MQNNRPFESYTFCHRCLQQLRPETIVIKDELEYNRCWTCEDELERQKTEYQTSNEAANGGLNESLY